MSRYKIVNATCAREAAGVLRARGYAVLPWEPENDYVLGLRWTTDENGDVAGHDEAVCWAAGGAGDPWVVDSGWPSTELDRLGVPEIIEKFNLRMPD